MACYCLLHGISHLQAAKKSAEEQARELAGLMVATIKQPKVPEGMYILLQDVLFVTYPVISLLNRSGFGLLMNYAAQGKHVARSKVYVRE